MAPDGNGSGVIINSHGTGSIREKEKKANGGVGVLSLVGGNNSRRGLLRLGSKGRGPVAADFPRRNPSYTSVARHSFGTNDTAAGSQCEERGDDDQGAHGLVQNVDTDVASVVGNLPGRHSTDGFRAKREVDVPSVGKGNDGTRSTGEKERNLDGSTSALSILGGASSGRGLLRLGWKARGPVAVDLPRRHPSYMPLARLSFGANDTAAGSRYEECGDKDRGPHELARGVNADMTRVMGDLPRCHSTDGFHARPKLDVPSKARGSGNSAHRTGSRRENGGVLDDSLGGPSALGSNGLGRGIMRLGSKARGLVATESPRRKCGCTSVARHSFSTNDTAAPDHHEGHRNEDRGPMDLLGTLTLTSPL